VKIYIQKWRLGEFIRRQEGVDSMRSLSRRLGIYEHTFDQAVRRQSQVSLDLFYAMHKEFGFEMKHVTCDGVPCKELGTDPRYGVFHATDEN
jgi:hypothetical protein